MLTTLEVILAKKPSKTDDLDAFDYRNEAAVILLGAIGKHLSKDDIKIVTISEMMVEALKTPSEAVQKVTIYLYISCYLSIYLYIITIYLSLGCF
jgi:hypothetical protein